MLSKRIVLLTTALTPSVWGTTYFVTTEYLPPDRPLLAATVRALPAGLALVAIARCLPRGAWWWRAAVLGALNIGAFNALLFFAAYRLPGGVAATIASMQPLLVGLLAAVLLGEHLGWRRAGAAIVGVAGVALLVLRANASLDAVGIAAAAASALVMATGIVLTKLWGSPASLLATTGWQLTAGGLLLLPLTLLVEGAPPSDLSGENIAAFAYLTIIGAAIAYAIWFRGLRELSPVSVSFLLLLSPLVATALGWLALGQSLAPAQLLGALLVLGAIVVAQTAGARPAADARPAPSSQPPLDQESTHMRITVFGAGGSVGSRVVAEAVRRGHDVTAVVRDPARVQGLPAQAVVRRGDATDVAQVTELAAGQDVVVGATRPPRGEEPELPKAARALLAGTREAGTRLLLVGGAATLVVPATGGRVVDDPTLVSEEWRAIALACADQHEVCRADDSADWTYLSPPALLEPGARTGDYRVGGDELLVDADGRSAISIEDFACALVDEAEQPRHRRARFTVAA